MFDQETLQKILGINEKVYIEPVEMANKMNITFFPHYSPDISPEILHFAETLKVVFAELNVNVVPYDQALIKLPILKVIKNLTKVLFNNIVYLVHKIFGVTNKGHYFSISAISFLMNRTKIKKGISVIVLGEQNSDSLPMQYINSFKHNSIITILDFPSNISTESSFHEHFDTAVALFSEHMTNIVIGVNKDVWLLYNFNASHPIFKIEENFKHDVLKALIPKIVAPIRPYTLSEFIISKEHFDITDSIHKPLVDDLVQGALIFDKTSLYPKGKKIDELPFRNDFYRWIGKLHLDNRNGMSYGFLAVQMPGEVSRLIPDSEFRNQIKINPTEKFFFLNGDLHVSLTLSNEKFWINVPPVWVLSQKSGSDKTHVNPRKDLIKMGLSNGTMILQNQEGDRFDNDYKTSFDTQVILAHAVGNAIIASILYHLNPNSIFAKRYMEKGISISHWHGYIHPEHVEAGWFVHGVANPHVACSSPQSAIFAIQGKLDSFVQSLNSNIEYKGDIHIEPHHGTNICYTSITDLSEYLVNNPTASVLGNSYYYLYNK